MKSDTDNSFNDPAGETFEFAVSQAVDDVLGEMDRRTLGSRLDGDDARRLAADHSRINTLLRTHDPLPAIDFDAFAARVSAFIADEPAYAPAPLRMPSAWPRRFAVAAGVAIAALVTWQVVPHGRGAVGGEIVVKGPGFAPLPATAVAEVRIGPSEVMVQRGLAMGIGQEKTSGQKPRVVITSADSPAANDARPY